MLPNVRTYIDLEKALRQKNQEIQLVLEVESREDQSQSQPATRVDGKNMARDTNSVYKAISLPKGEK